MPRPRLGQHFLQDHAVVQRHLSYANLTTKDTVLEIGPGTGVLTLPMAAQVQQVIAVELDESLYQQLQKKTPNNVTLLQGDILQLDWKTLPPWNKVLANIPYEISSPLTFQLLQHQFDCAVLMYQKDFAQRMVAQPHTKDYSRLTVSLYYYTHCTIMEEIPPTSFSPPPKIESCLVKLVPRTTPPFTVEDETVFFDIVKQVFLHRRKTIKNALSPLIGTDANNVSYADQRAEELTPEQLGHLSDEIYYMQK